MQMRQAYQTSSGLGVGEGRFLLAATRRRNYLIEQKDCHTWWVPVSSLTAFLEKAALCQEGSVIVWINAIDFLGARGKKRDSTYTTNTAHMRMDSQV